MTSCYRILATIPEELVSEMSEGTKPVTGALCLIRRGKLGSSAPVSDLPFFAQYRARRHERVRQKIDYW